MTVVCIECVWIVHGVCIGQKSAMEKPAPDYSFEAAAHARGLPVVAGTDEVGRGPLAGPVVAAAVVLDPDNIPEGLNDSKVLTLKRRVALAEAIHATAFVAIAEASVEEIEQVNILQASHLAMVRAVSALPVTPDHVLIDGNRIPKGLNLSAEPIVKGDARSLSIAAASIVAKIRRDEIMVELAQHYPEYGWQTNAGYPTKSHTLALHKFGPTPHHRRTFKPVHNILYQDKIVTR